MEMVVSNQVSCGDREQEKAPTFKLIARLRTPDIVPSNSQSLIMHCSSFQTEATLLLLFALLLACNSDYIGAAATGIATLMNPNIYLLHYSKLIFD
jgi:hypothetical protein